MVMMTGTAQAEEVDIELRKKLSKFLEQMFMCKKNCSICWNTGVRVYRRSSGTTLHYAPCSCLIAREDIKKKPSIDCEPDVITLGCKDDKKTVGSTEK